MTNTNLITLNREAFLHQTVQIALEQTEELTKELKEPALSMFVSLNVLSSVRKVSNILFAEQEEVTLDKHLVQRCIIEQFTEDTAELLEPEESDSPTAAMNKIITSAIVFINLTTMQNRLCTEVLEIEQESTDKTSE